MHDRRIVLRFAAQEGAFSSPTCLHRQWSPSDLLVNVWGGAHFAGINRPWRVVEHKPPYTAFEVEVREWSLNSTSLYAFLACVGATVLVYCGNAVW